MRQVGDWLQHESEVVHKNPYYQVRKDKVTKPDGSDGEYYVTESSDAVFIIAVDDEGRVMLVGLHRYPVEKYSLEIPAGGVEEYDKDSLAAAKRELMEEAGLEAKNWKRLGMLHPANGFFNECNEFYLATGLSDAGSHQQEEEGIQEVKKVKFTEVMQMIESGEITDMQTVAGLTLAAIELNKFKK